jgi:hypothetical protein
VPPPADGRVGSQAVVLDECHKAPKKWLAHMSAARLRLALSGTPAEDVPGVLDLLNAVDPPRKGGTRNFPPAKYVKPAAHGALRSVKRFLHYLAPPLLLALPALDYLAGDGAAVTVVGLATYIASSVLSLRNWEVDLNDWNYELLAEDAAPWIYHVKDSQVVVGDDC